MQAGLPLPASTGALIAGASFAGLAVARMLGSDTVVIDRNPLGAGQTSACGAPVSVVERLGAAGSILQRHDHLIVAVGGRAERWALPEPFCTFDYGACCRLAAEGTPARFVQSSLLGVRDGRAITSEGEIGATVIVDATGPRSPLTRAARGRRAAFGIETELPVAMPDGLLFYFLPEVRDGYAWAFPSGSTTRFGVLSYLGASKLMPALRAFLKRFGLAPGELHGGYLTTGLRPALARDDRVFVVGDAAGQCLPLTGEGIRTAVLAGEYCGRLIAGVLEEKWSLGEAAVQYRAFVEAERRPYRGLLWANAAALVLPRPLLSLLVRATTHPRVLRLFFTHYLSIFAQGSPARLSGLATEAAGGRF